jgi:alpha-ketoglutarate-dependent 2,4-dichlorophenoxyacetate dioxygenase
VTIAVTRLTPSFAARIDGADIGRPLDAATWSAIRAAFEEHSVLLFRDQPLDDAAQIAFSRRFGELEVTRSMNPAAGTPFARQSNLDIKTGEVIPPDDRRMVYQLANMLWHSDSSFKPVPAKYSLLSARTIPEAGGNTEFADMRAAYDALDEATKREVHDLVCRHSQIFSRGILGFTDFTEEERVKWAPVRQRLVRRHPTTGRLSLYLASHAGEIEGWPVPEARAFLRDLTEHATQRQFVYAHVWRLHDLVMWDNRVTMHRARRYDHTEVRDMRRTTLTNEVSSLEQAP